jgi:hypothetical protein
VAIYRDLALTRNTDDHLDGAQHIDVIPNPRNREPTLKEEERDLESRLAWGFLGAGDPQRELQHLVGVILEIERAGHP